MTTNKLAKGSLFGAKKSALASRIEDAKATQDPLKVENKIFLLVDDSGSMSGQKLNDAKKAVSEFLRTCNPQNTSVGLYSFAATNYPLSCDFILLDILKDKLQADYGTPLYNTLGNIINGNQVDGSPSFNRVVALSDGSPTDWDGYDSDGPESTPGPIINSYIVAKIPIDTVYIGLEDTDHGAITLKRIAEWTGGIFLHFKDSGTFAKSFKFLAPAFRAMLTDGKFKEQIEKGL